jgi:hypothetical protein
MAPGMHMPMPVIIHPDNMEEWKREQEEQETREPEFTAVRWSVASVKEGERVELSAEVQDIDDGNSVTFQIWRQDQDPASHIPIAQISGRGIVDGVATGEWKYTPPRGKELPADDPEFFITAHSAWCPFERSDELTVELIRPEITEFVWRDDEGDETEKNVLGELVTLSVETKDVEDGKTVTFKIFPEGADTKKDKPLKMLDAAVSEDKAEISYNFADLQPKPVIDEAMYKYYKEQGKDVVREEFEFFLEDYDKELESTVKEKPKYIYTANAWKCAEVKSEALEVSKTLIVKYKDAFHKPVEGVRFKVKESDGTEHEATTNEEGIAEFEDLIPTNNYFDYERVEEDESSGASI